MLPGIIAYLVGFFLAVGPWTIAGWPESLKWISTGIGASVLVLTTLLAVFTKLYRKPTADQAFVRTGVGKARVILDGGSLVIPMMHRLREVSLQTMRLDVKRVGADALITKDYLRADICSEFYIRVKPAEQDILDAARSLGDKSVSSQAVSELVFEKLVSALRSVAATKELLELNIKRDEFAAAVQENLASDLRQNGLWLETVTISQLDQTAPENLNANNVFDAQGLRKITLITQEQNVERNRIDLDAQQAMKEKAVATRKQLLEFERDQAEAEAAQATEVANIQAIKLRERQQFEIEQRRQVELAGISKEETVKKADIAKSQGIQMADVSREREVQIADVLKQQSIQEAEVAKQQAVEVARRAAQIQVAKKETERAVAESQTRAAEAQREEQTQKVETVKVTSAADRSAQEKMIKERQEVDIKKYRQQIEADVHAYELAKVAAGELEAAENQRQAKLILAEAEAEAAKRRAAGEQAVLMVPVSVDRERVEVENARVNVERQALQNKQEFSEAALKFEVQKLEIQMSAEVQKAFAESIGNMLSKANMQIFGDPTTLSDMTGRFMRSVGWGQAINGFRSALPDDLSKLASDVISGSGEALSGALRKMTGNHVEPELLEQLVRRVMEQRATPTPTTAADGAPRPAKPARGDDKSGGKPNA